MDDDFWAIYRAILPYYFFLVTACAYAANALLLYLIRTTRTSVVMEYRTLLMVGAVYDIFYTTVHGSCQMVITYGKGMLFVVNTFVFERVPQPYSEYITLLMSGSNHGMRIIVALQCLYRYSMICRGHPLRNSEAGLFLGVFGVLLLINAYTGYYGFVHDPDLLNGKYMVEFLKHPIWRQNTPVFSPVDSTDIRGKVYTLNMMTMIAVTYAVILFTFGKTYWRLSRMSEKFSAQTRKSERILNKLMLTQAVTVLILSLLPNLLAIPLILLRLDFHTYSPLVSPPTSLLPLLNPLLTMYMVPSIWRNVLHLVGGVKTTHSNSAILSHVHVFSHKTIP